MKAHLPIRAHATKQLLPSLKISKPGVQIIEVINLGDEGGISCLLKVSEQDTTAHLVSLTHLRLANSHPLAKDVRAYQFARIQKLALG